MKNLITKNLLKMAVVGMNIIMLTACNGIFDDIYDQPKEIVPAKGQMVINATSWTDWYYVDLNELHQLTINGDEEALLKAQTEFTAYPIPMEPTGDKVTTPVTDLRCCGRPSVYHQDIRHTAYHRPYGCRRCLRSWLYPRQTEVDRCQPTLSRLRAFGKCLEEHSARRSELGYGRRNHKQSDFIGRQNTALKIQTI